VYIPLHTPTSYDVTKPFAHGIARLLEHEHPELIVSEMKKEIRGGKVFVDWSQNDEHKTTVSVYSLRAREHPTVSTPVTWDEVERALKKKDARLLVFEAPDVVKRFEKMGDLHAPVLELKQKLPDVRAAAGQPALAKPEKIELAAQAEEPEAPAESKSGAPRKSAATTSKRTAGKTSKKPESSRRTTLSDETVASKARVKKRRAL
jgi:bifunctional non-homologous end joining protein LigD